MMLSTIEFVVFLCVQILVAVCCMLVLLPRKTRIPTLDECFTDPKLAIMVFDLYVAGKISRKEFEKWMKRLEVLDILD